jgi:hypothetical protein
MANARGVYIIWYREVLRYRRDRVRLISSLGQPLLFLVVFGSGLTASLGAGLTKELGDVSYVRFLFPGIVAMAVLFTAVFSAISIVWDREFGFLREVLVAPLSRAAVVVGKALGGSTVAMCQGAILLPSIHGSVPDDHELPHHAHVLPERCVLPLEGTAGLDEHYHPLGPCGLWCGPDAPSPPWR